jgi:hypothetical protein
VINKAYVHANQFTDRKYTLKREGALRLTEDTEDNDKKEMSLKRLV